MYDCPLGSFFFLLDLFEINSVIFILLFIISWYETIIFSLLCWLHHTCFDMCYPQGYSEYLRTYNKQSEKCAMTTNSSHKQLVWPYWCEPADTSYFTFIGIYFLQPIILPKCTTWYILNTSNIFDPYASYQGLCWSKFSLIGLGSSQMKTP